MPNRRRSRRWWLLVVVAVAAFAGYRFLPPKALPAHSGDGEFTDLSWRARACGVPVIDVRGYAVSMPRFNLGQDYTAEYRVARLPDIGRECRLYLAIDDPQDRWLFRDDEICKLRGALRLEVIDANGDVVYHSEGPLSSYVWGNWFGAHRLYQLEAERFLPDPGNEYTLRVVYQADPALAGYCGYCYLECHPKL